MGAVPMLGGIQGFAGAFGVLPLFARVHFLHGVVSVSPIFWWALL